MISATDRAVSAVCEHLENEDLDKDEQIDVLVDCLKYLIDGDGDLTVQVIDALSD